MSIVITTPTGKIGSKLASRLMKSGEKIVLISRNADKVSDLAQKGAEVFVGAHDDQSVVDKATYDADALFFVSPPDMGTHDARAHHRQFGQVAANAIKKNHIRHVVHLSSIGANLKTKTGPVLGLHDNEQLLKTSAANLAQLRPGYFMENILWQIPLIKQTGKIVGMFDKKTKIPMVATKDIAARASQLLWDRDWKGNRVVELPGPEDISYQDIARVLSEIVGRTVSYIQISEQQSRQALIEMGASDHMAEQLNILANSLETGHVKFTEPRAGASRGTTRFPIFANEVFKPAFDAS